MTNTNAPDSAVAVKALKPVSEEYFLRLIRKIEKAGYKLFSRAAIDTNECDYHISVTYARETALFFHLPGRKLILHLVFREHDNPGWQQAPTQYWAVNFYREFHSVQKLVEMTYVPGENREPWDRGPSPLDKIPLYRAGLSLPGFRWCGLRYEQESVHDEPIGPELLASMITRELYPALKYLAFGRFSELQVTDFWPHYTFPRSNQIFWSRFNTEAFKKIVKRPWGGEPLR